MSGVLIADEQGLGKTVQALAVCEAANLFPAVVVCPTAVRLNWQREVGRWLPHRTVKVVYGTAPTSETVDVLILGWDVLHAWTDALPSARAAIFDEAHLAKNGQSRRTKAAIRYADRVRDGEGVVIAMTGTPIVNRPTELIPILRLIGRLNDFGGAAAFRHNYKTPADLRDLNRRLRAACFVRRRKIDVLKELPPKRYATVPMETTDPEMAEYRAAEAQILAYLATKARDAALSAGASTKEARRAAAEAAIRASAAEHLVALTALRRLAVGAKLAAVDEWLADFAQTGHKAVIFAWHRDIVDLLAARYANGCAVRGEMADHDRQAAIDRFQHDPAQQFIVCSIKAAGVGITLTAAADVVFVEQGWSPADMDQAADRCHRIGQTDSVTAWTLVAVNTIDDDMTALITAKRTIVDAVADGERVSDSDASSVVADLLIRMAFRE